MSNATTRPELRVTVFSDYVCPFCYIGFVRLEKLRAQYDLKVNWCLIEIHPDNPPEGRPVSELGYSPEQWDEMMGNLGQMAKEEGVAIGPHTCTSNSHKALLLAEASKQHGAEVFYPLHRRLFEVYLSEGRNIGDETVLREVAAECGVPEATVEQAWSDPQFETRLRHNLFAALELEVTGTPTYFFGERKLSGALPTEHLFAAARQAVHHEPPRS